MLFACPSELLSIHCMHLSLAHVSPLSVLPPLVIPPSIVFVACLFLPPSRTGSLNKNNHQFLFFFQHTTLVQQKLSTSSALTSILTCIHHPHIQRPVHTRIQNKHSCHKYTEKIGALTSFALNQNTLGALAPDLFAPCSQKQSSKGRGVKNFELEVVLFPASRK
ncbi:MAG: hypothetical protein J3R72DRAFT_118649 [Linnemannia gamsii]|nr:MAG: hypothetical protein J3R72DRAFT_118649 [Linnemannia gamsii]